MPTRRRSRFVPWDSRSVQYPLEPYSVSHPSLRQYLGRAQEPTSRRVLHQTRTSSALPNAAANLDWAEFPTSNPGIQETEAEIPSSRALSGNNLDATSSWIFSDRNTDGVSTRFSSGRISPGSASDRISQGNISGRSSDVTSVSALSMNRDSRDSLTQLNPNREWSFHNIDTHAIVERDFRFVTITPSSSMEDVNDGDQQTSGVRDPWTEDETEFLIEVMAKSLSMKAMETAQEELLAMAKRRPYSMGTGFSNTSIFTDPVSGNRSGTLFETFQRKCPETVNDLCNRATTSTHARNQTRDEPIASVSNIQNTDYSISLADFNNSTLRPQQQRGSGGVLSQQFPEGGTTPGLPCHIFSKDRLPSSQQRQRKRIPRGTVHCDEVARERQRHRKNRYISDPSVTSGVEWPDDTHRMAKIPASLPVSPGRGHVREQHPGHRKHNKPCSQTEERDTGQSRSRRVQYVLEDNPGANDRYASRKDGFCQRYIIAGSPKTTISVRYDSARSFYPKFTNTSQAERYGHAPDNVLTNYDPPTRHDPGMFRDHSTHRLTDYFDCRPPNPGTQGRSATRLWDRSQPDLSRSLSPRNSRLVEDWRLKEEPLHERIWKYHEDGILVLDFSTRRSK